MKRLMKCLVLLVITALLVPSATAGERAAVPVQKETVEAYAPGDDRSYVRYPVFSTEDESLAEGIDKANRLIREKARIPEYLQLLSTVGAGGVGLRMDYTLSAFTVSDENGPALYDSYVSILFSAEGKMLSGRPSQVYYTVTVDLKTGEEIPFGRLFSDPDGAKAYIEETVENEIEPTLSTYLENNRLFPVPYDRYWIDNAGHVHFYYENSQLSFLSGDSGAISLRYSELDPWLDKTENGLIAHFAYGNAEDRTPESNWHWLRGGTLLPCAKPVSIGESIESVESRGALRFTADSGYYPGGAFLEAEACDYRGTLILTDESEETVTGFLCSRIDLFGLSTGKTSIQDAEACLGRVPDARIGIDETAAQIYGVCPGEASVYLFESAKGEGLSLTLYADGAGVLRYMKLALE